MPSWLAATSAAPVRWLQRVAGGMPPPAAGDPREDPAGWPAALLDALPDPLVVVDADDRVQAANRAAEVLLGYATGALAGAGLAEAVLRPRDRDAHRGRLRRHADPGPGDRSKPVPLVRADGSEITAEVTVRPVAGSGQFVVRVRPVATAAPSAAEAALTAARDVAESRQRMLRTIVDAIPDPVVAVDRAGHVVFRNRASVHLDADEFTPEQWAEADAVMRTGRPVADREEPDAAGGVRLTTRIPVRDPAGAVVGLVALSRDVTAQKAAEARLRDDKQAAEAATRANTEFLVTTSHEIRTLMNGVTGMTNLLLDTDLDDEQREFVDIVRTSSDALLTIINDILDFSKIEAGMLALEDQPLDVRRVVEEVRSMVAPQAAAKGLALAAEVAPSVPEEVFGDATRVRQVLVNLLTNAIKFTDAGSVRVRVGRASEAASGLAFAVEDTGVGIAPDRLEAVFERYAQADVSTARTHGGTGLGLAICRRLVQMMGGELSAESEPGVGSVFRFTVAVRFPADALPEATTPPPSASAVWITRPAVEPETPDGERSDVSETTQAEDEARPAEALPTDRTRPDQAVVLSMDAMLPGARVLLAEDNPVNQKVTMLTLRRLGYRPDVVADGAQAVEAVHRHAYDVVLMDVMMPVMDGLEATRRIRAAPGRHPMPAIVALTAMAMSDDRQKCLDAGCDDYLSKPVAPRLLAATIERAVRSRRAAAVHA